MRPVRGVLIAPPVWERDPPIGFTPPRRVAGLRGFGSGNRHRRDSVGRRPRARGTRNPSPGGEVQDGVAVSDIDEPSGADQAPVDSAAPRRSGISRRALVFGGIAVGGLAALGGGALVYREIRRSAPPEGTWVKLSPIVPVPEASPRPVS